MKLSIIVPVFKGEATLVPLFNRIQETLAGIFDFEVIFVSDNAIDNSWSRIKYLHSANSQKVKGFKLKFNYGQHKAILYGIKKATGDYLITMDEDMQHDPKYISQMLSYLLDNNLDVVYGTFLSDTKNAMRKFGSKFGRKIAAILIPELYKGYSPFRILNRSTANKLFDDKRIAFIDGQLGFMTNKFGEYPIEHLENKRPSSYSFFKLIQLAVSVILFYSKISRGLLFLLISFLMYFSLVSVVNLPGRTIILEGLPSFITLLIVISFLFNFGIKTQVRKTICVDETVGTD